MVKRQKEKQYQSAQEHRANSQWRKASQAATIRPLPFSCCALTLTPYTDPVCSTDGIIFENSAILPHLVKFKKDPVTGRPMTSRDLISLQMDKDEEGRWQCPILCKAFSNHSKIVAIIQRPPGNEANVYSFEAVQELNYKTKNYHDLISGLKFSKKTDVVLLQDPENDELNSKRDISNFHHVLHQRQSANQSNSQENVRHSVTARRVMDTIEKKRKSEAVNNKSNDSSRTEKKKIKIFTDEISSVKLTTGKASGSLTSTAMDITSLNEAREASEEEVQEALFAALRKLKKKGYVTVHTNVGDFGLEIHCDIVPRTAVSFMGLVKAGRYNGTSFHRSVKNFMIQCGKLVGSKEKEGSLWGNSFKDEFDDRLTHSGPGIVSMANAGPNTNKQQFFITYTSCNHLDRKHSVFGRVVNGMDVVKDMEKVETDKHDRPVHDIKISSIEILSNPVGEAEQAERQRIQKRVEQKKRQKEECRYGGKTSSSKSVSTAMAQDSSHSAVQTSGIGKYLPSTIMNKKTSSNESEEGAMITPSVATVPKKTTFGDFSGW